MYSYQNPASVSHLSVYEARKHYRMVVALGDRLGSLLDRLDRLGSHLDLLDRLGSLLDLLDLLDLLSKLE
jgi:hypothetical protein